jgi:hypothetical protein
LILRERGIRCGHERSSYQRVRRSYQPGWKPQAVPVNPITVRNLSLLIYVWVLAVN